MKLSIGPGALVAAAFIGPGTVTACMVAGANFGYAFIWALVFATAATIILQDMSARLGVVAKMGLGEAMMTGAGHSALKAMTALLVMSALAVGNAAYEAGNLAGGALGLQAIFAPAGATSSAPYVLGIGFIAGGALLYGRYRVLERLLIGLVGLMSLAFTASILLVQPDIGALLSGLIPRIPDGGQLTMIALIGTTIVPYNLFLHAAAARNRWQGGTADLAAAAQDTRLSIGLGGLVSIFILSTAAATLFGTGTVIGSAGEMALALDPLAGPAARYLVGIGLFAAGLTSAITAPMATAYAMTELFPDLMRKHESIAFRSIALGILLIGLSVSLLGLKPVDLILFAQIANGLLLPIIAIFLLIAMNRRSLLGDYVNSRQANVLGGLTVAIVLFLGSRTVYLKGSALLQALG